MAVLTRTEWVQLRDKTHKVSKGAVSGVSMGDALDAYHKEGAKGLDAALKAAPKLKTAAEKYLKGCKSEGLKKDVKSKIIDQLAAVEKCPLFLKEIEAVKTAWLSFKKQPSETTRVVVQRLITPLREDGKRSIPPLRALNLPPTAFGNGLMVRRRNRFLLTPVTSKVTSRRWRPSGNRMLCHRSPTCPGGGPDGQRSAASAPTVHGMDGSQPSLVRGNHIQLRDGAVGLLGLFVEDHELQVAGLDRLRQLHGVLVGLFREGTLWRPAGPTACRPG